MLVPDFIISYLKNRSYYFIIFISLSFCQFFINPQRPLFDLLKWEEINSNNILLPTVGPPVITDPDSSDITSFYYSSTKSNRLMMGEIFPEVSINNTDGTRLRLYGTAGITLSKRLTIQNEFEFDNQGEDDPHFHGSLRNSAQGWVGYLQHSSVNYFYSLGHIAMGRGNPFFYNMSESLLLNPRFPPAEFMWWQHGVKWFQFDWGVLLLNKMGLNNRFLSFHRYGLVHTNWRVGFTEAVLGTYNSLGTREIGYFMPAGVHLETEVNRSINTNLFWLFDGMLKWNGWTFTGEFLIDDFAVDGLSPHQIAGSAGVGRKINNLLFINGEYTRISRWTGNYCDSLKQWVEKDVPIGHSIGSDAHQLLVNSYYPLNDKVAVALSLRWMEDGGGLAIERLFDWPNDVPCENNFGYNSAPFPSTSNITSSGETKFYYLMQDWILAEMHIIIDKKMPPYYKVAFSLHLD